MPASRIFRFARTSRCASVGSGTRNARAISAVVRPPTRLSVSATCASAASAGWQQAKISSSRSSGIAVLLVVRAAARARASSSRLRVRACCSRRMRSIARLRAVATIQAPGFAGVAVARPALGGDRERVLYRVLGEVEVAEDADQRWRGRGPHSSRKTRASLRARARTTGRTSIVPPRRAAGMRRGPLDRLVEVVGLDEVVAAERLLRLGERAVGDERLAVADADGRRRVAPAGARSPPTTPGATPRRRRTRRRSRCCSSSERLSHSVSVVVDQQQVLHVSPPSRRSVTTTTTNGRRRIDNGFDSGARGASARRPCRACSFRLPHFGLWTQEGQPSLARAAARAGARCRATQPSNCSKPRSVMPTPPGWPS